MQEDLGRAPNTVAAYRRALEDYLAFCSRQALLPEAVKREDIARYVRDRWTPVQAWQMLRCCSV